MDPTFISAFVSNVGVLALCCALVCFLGWRAGANGRDSGVYQGAAALIFPVMLSGLIGFAVIAPTGQLLDVRAAPALLAGALGGVPAAVTSALAGAVLRMVIGGPFALAGVISVLIFCGLGLLARTAWSTNYLTFMKRLGLFSVGAMIVALPTLLVGVPFETGINTFKTYAPFLTVVNPIAVAVLGSAYWVGYCVQHSRSKVRLLQSALASSGNGILITDASSDPKIVFANEGVTRNTGYEVDELIGRSPRIFHEGLPDQPGLKALCHAIKHREHCGVEVINRRKDGGEFINHLTVAPVVGRNGEVAHFIGVQDDVTALRKNEHLVHMVTDRLPLSLVLLDLEKRVLLTNQSFRKWFRFAPGEAEGQLLTDVVGAREHARLQDAVGQALAGKRVIREFTAINPATDQLATLRETFLPAYTSRSALLTECIWIVEDISEQRRAEEELRQSHKMRSIGDLTGGIAHDFNNLNAVVIGNLELLSEISRGKDVEPFLGEALNAAYRAADLTKSLLSFGRRAPLQPRVFSAPDQFASLEPLLRASVPETITLSLKLDQEVVSLRLDPSSFDNAILNLVLNARDAIGKATGAVDVTLAIETVTDQQASDGGITWFAGDLSKMPEGRYLTIGVCDTGAGVDPDVRSRMFDPFVTTKGVEIGNGLGLSMVDGFVHQSGGLMRVGDRPDGGTIVKLWFPTTVLADTDQPEPALSGSTIRMSSRNRVVLVEDEAAVRRILARRLTGLGFQVIDFPSGDQALASFERTGPPDLLFSDMVLSGNVQGPDLARHVKSIWPSVKVILASGYPAVDLADRANETHDVFLQKPFTQAELVAAVRACLPEANLSRAKPSEDGTRPSDKPEGIQEDAHAALIDDEN